ncbi:MAG: 50S ribosomal protein L2 [Candidatus Colwellbacteria bacterium CG10_big_fil_rev_8_21_14_0_10_41_28]|uniref:Large ribosomal subunit protein uL2 n=1 Tax=Candidatus Colwellbacteria bacterium CG10_big_fil_rev_8_21_14_0_10_41_28 TaxID=1974539 RepID=A0A2H0VH55_9BACT|nr:MAG: 50S ribosomal protein L2 [Candidatus Colwellbacteria bacterium CG10_big_fil_rev_8_21_14_0_10_41_28]
MKKYKPYTASRRHMSVVEYGSLSKDKPMKSALKKIHKKAGRNNLGRITTRHKGGGVKRRYRDIDFKRDKHGVEGRIEGLEYDPYRSAFIMKVVYLDGERRYHLAHAGAKVAEKIVSGPEAPLKEGNRMPLLKVPVGYEIHDLELKPGGGGKIIRSAGSSAQVLSHDGKYSQIKLPSTEVRKVISTSYGTVGQVSNPDHGLTVIGKAGRKRKMGVRPTVRGTAMNAVDHPFGGGEGRQPMGRKRPKDVYGNVIKGPKTRKKKKWSTKLIVKRRAKRKRGKK